MITKCFKCDLCLGRRNIVNPSGDLTNCKILFIGEAPGSTEDRLGLPFVGKAGKLLDRMFGLMNMNRNRGIVITNVIKCQPPNNRPPTNIEINLCFPYLQSEIEELNPTLIVGMGNTALKAITGETTNRISKWRGKYIIQDNRIFYFTYHPSYLLKNQEDDKIFKEFYSDFKFIQKMYTIL